MIARGARSEGVLVKGSSMIGARWMPVVLAAGLTIALLTSAAAHAAEDTIGIDVPVEATEVWIDVEQAGLDPEDVVVTAAVAGGAGRPVTLARTSFGLHGQVAATAGRLSVTAIAPAGAASSTPDVALTVVDAGGTVIAAENVRARLIAGAPTAVDSDSDEPGRGDAAPGASGSGGLAVTGGGVIGIGLAIALLLTGAAALLWRRRRHRLAPAVTESMGR